MLPDLALAVPGVPVAPPVQLAQSPQLHPLLLLALVALEDPPDLAVQLAQSPPSRLLIPEDLLAQPDLADPYNQSKKRRCTS